MPDLERKLLCHQEEFSGSEPEYDSDYDDLDTAGQLSSFMNMFNKKGAGKKKSNSKIYSGILFLMENSGVQSPNLIFEPVISAMEKHFDKMDTQKTGFINIGSLSDYIINEFKMECDDQQKEDFKVMFHTNYIFVSFIHVDGWFQTLFKKSKEFFFGGHFQTYA